MEGYQAIPTLTNFINELGENVMDKEIDSNYKQIKLDAQLIVDAELTKIRGDEKLKHLLKDK